MRKLWQDILLPSNDEFVWELFHENSKRGKYDEALSKDDVLRAMGEFHQSLPFRGFPVVQLPQSVLPLPLSLSEVLAGRCTSYEMTADCLTLEQVATLLHYSYGVMRDNKNTSAPRPSRVVPSAGGLYPLEIYLASSHIEGLKPGLYHYNPVENNLRLLHGGDGTAEISKSLIQPEIASQASLIIFITGIFERSIFKYGDRGYRFVFLEAGHVAQNLNLIAHALKLGSLNIGGYFDREIDHFLDLDGIAHSTIYIMAIGRKKQEQELKIS
jgi:SagB-type dehydrogenase family enzyme